MAYLMVLVLRPTAQQCWRPRVCCLKCCNTNLISRVNFFCFSAASTPLTVKKIQNELREMTAEWYQLGVQLEIPPATLNTIERDHPRDAQRCMTEVITRWLRNATECSWAKLAQAVEAMGGYVALAEKLTQKTSQGKYQHLCTYIATFYTVT